jgi:hypothetical protein
MLLVTVLNLNCFFLNCDNFNFIFVLLFLKNFFLFFNLYVLNVFDELVLFDYNIFFFDFFFVQFLHVLSKFFVYIYSIFYLIFNFYLFSLVTFIFFFYFFSGIVWVLLEPNWGSWFFSENIEELLLILIFFFFITD